MRMAGQRIVARLRERTYAAALKQEVEFVERGEGDVLSRLSVDSSVVGERYNNFAPAVKPILIRFRQCDAEPVRWFAGSRDGFCWP
jgi:ABC-type multidrug transport system fused ATPase/permease subunit